MGSGNTTPAATDVYTKWWHNARRFNFLLEVGTQHQQLLISIGDGSQDQQLVYRKWWHNTRRFYFL